VVEVDVAREGKKDGRGQNVSHHLPQRAVQFGMGHCVQGSGGQVEPMRMCHAQERVRRLRLSPDLLHLIARIMWRLALRDHHHMHLDTTVGQQGDRAAASQHLVIRMRCHHERAAGIVGEARHARCPSNACCDRLAAPAIS
jgi:hypothetical protein